MKTKIQKSNRQPGVLLSAVLVLLPIMVLMGNVLSRLENPDLARVEFFVS
jgi:hypothetical protein